MALVTRSWCGWRRCRMDKQQVWMTKLIAGIRGDHPCLLNEALRLQDLPAQGHSAWPRTGMGVTVPSWAPSGRPRNGTEPRWAPWRDHEKERGSGFTSNETQAFLLSSISFFCVKFNQSSVFRKHLRQKHYEISFPFLPASFFSTAQKNCQDKSFPYGSDYDWFLNQSLPWKSLDFHLSLPSSGGHSSVCSEWSQAERI